MMLTAFELRSQKKQREALAHNHPHETGEPAAGTVAGMPRFMGARIQPKLAVGRVGDGFEQEADRVADQVMSAPANTVRSKCACGGSSGESGPCAACQMAAGGTANAANVMQRQSAEEGAQTAAPPLVGDVLSSPGHPLDSATRQLMESRLGARFDGVRVHTDESAAKSAGAINALAYTVGSDVVFAAGSYAPGSSAGRKLLAHELTHVAQQRGSRASIRTQRFNLPHGAATLDETPLIAPTYGDLLATIKALISASTLPGGMFGDTVNMDLMVQKAGGLPASAALGIKSTPTVASMLNYRYLFTCRCGLIDMRHFMQLMYISHFIASAFPGADANRAATRKGREHELTSESESRFGAEDTPTNALGASVGTRLAGTPMPNDLFAEIERTLSRCDPRDFGIFSPASKSTVVHFYGDLIADPAKPGDLIPANQNQTAVPDILNLPECGGRERSFPFKLDTDDPDRKTIAGTAFDTGSTGLTSDSQIKDFVATQRSETIAALSSSEKVRLAMRLFAGWLSDEDIDAIEVIYKNSTTAEKDQIRAAINVNDASGGQRTRLKVIFS